MIYLFHEEAGSDTITLEGDNFKHMIKARRHGIGDTVHLRKPDDDQSYFYTITACGKKDARLELTQTQKSHQQQVKPLHLGWCIIDPKSVEKVLPSLSELGVAKITFIYAARSQHQFKVDTKRLERILINSMQQSGRFDMMAIESGLSLQEFIAQNPQALVLDFCDRPLSDHETFDTVILGPEGGFNDEEKALLASHPVRRLDTPMVLRSETAAIAVASKLLL